MTGRAGVPDNASAVVLNLTALDSTNPPDSSPPTPVAAHSPTSSNLNYSPGAVIANSATVPVGTGGKVCLYTYSATNLIVDINGWYPANSDFTPTTPTRLLDTRTTARAGSGAVTEVQVTGPAGVPSNASAVVLNLTAPDSTEPGGFVTAYPCGGALPDAPTSTTPRRPSSPTPPPSPSAPAARSASTPTKPPTSSSTSTAGTPPTATSPPPPPPASSTPAPPRAGAGAVTEVQITGRAGVAVNASAVVLNLTALDCTTGGFVTAYPCGGALPNVSNLNYSPAAPPSPTPPPSPSAPAARSASTPTQPPTSSSTSTAGTPPTATSPPPPPPDSSTPAPRRQAPHRNRPDSSSRRSTGTPVSSDSTRVFTTARDRLAHETCER